MTKLILLLASFFISTLSISQQFSFDINFKQGKISHIYQQAEEFIFKISDSGQLKEVLYFDTVKKAREYLKSPTLSLKPNKQINLGKSNLFIESFSQPMDYYADGRLKSIGHIKLQYHLMTYNNSRIYSVGKLKKIAGINIEYYHNRSDYNHNKISGKIKSINSQVIKYNHFNDQNEIRHISNLIQSISDITIKYYNSSSVNHQSKIIGKLKELGDIKFKYFNHSQSNKNANNVGGFKTLKNQDSRLSIL
ncbi:MAG: hypothetical protein HRU38_05405 [Saccharospirillaceae bacterium]|nr:hypothetical protein [Pseudomonadales bacterium]NRB78093.1 hypothetical protein [Saccharospirillaceae bacterium]